MRFSPTWRGERLLHIFCLVPLPYGTKLRAAPIMHAYFGTICFLMLPIDAMLQLLRTLKNKTEIKDLFR